MLYFVTRFQTNQYPLGNYSVSSVAYQIDCINMTGFSLLKVTFTAGLTLFSYKKNKIIYFDSKMLSLSSLEYLRIIKIKVANTPALSDLNSHIKK